MISDLRLLKKKLIVLGSFSIDEVLPYLTDKSSQKREYRVGDNVYQIRMNSQRYYVFRNSLKCAVCGLEGKYFLLEKHANDRTPHFNLYAEENGETILFTKDHILPKSKNGQNIFPNFQTCCEICNQLKGDLLLNVEQVAELRRVYNDSRGLPRKQRNALLEAAKSNF